MNVDLSRRRRIHVVGVGGAGMSAIATALVEMGHAVSGSDLRASRLLDRLRAAGIGVDVGHVPEHIADAEIVAVSSAVPGTNLEVREAHRRGLPVVSRAELLAAISATRRTAAVAGTHGKTTTSSMLALALVEAGQRPSYIIGGDVATFGTNAVWEDSEVLVVEADESDGSFLQLRPEVALVTNVEPDHIEHYGSFEALEEAFAAFLASSAAPPLVAADDPVAARIAPTGARSFGFSEGATYRIASFEGARSRSRFELEGPDGPLGAFILPVPGEHNVRNAAAAAAAALLLGAGIEDVRRALSRYGGVPRRFKFRGESGGITFVDDYAHLPGEVRAAIAAARLGGWRRIVCVFQPHRYSRTETLWRSFADSFADADLVVVTSIYAADEAPRPGVTGKLVLDAVLGQHPETRAAYLPQREELVNFLRAVLAPGDLCLTLGAGDLTTLPGDLITLLAAPARSSSPAGPTPPTDRGGLTGKEP